MLEYKEFAEELKAQVAEKMGEGYTADVREVTKANLGKADMLAIFHKDVKGETGPGFRLTPLFQEYREGKGMDAIARDIVEAYPVQARYGQEVMGSLGGIRGYEACRDRIYFRLANTGKNREYLEGMLHMGVLDLSIVFYVLVGESSSELVSVGIKEELLRLWGVPVEEVVAQAGKNTPRLFPASVQTLTAALRSLLEETGGYGEVQPWENCHVYGQEEPYIMSNTKGMNGFSTILYPGVLKNFSGIKETDLYILPCSLHEAILLPVDSCLQLQKLQDMVREINRDAVGSEDFLSDSVYYYDRTKNELRIAGREGNCVKL